MRGRVKWIRRFRFIDGTRGGVRGDAPLVPMAIDQLLYFQMLKYSI